MKRMMHTLILTLLVGMTGTTGNAYGETPVSNDPLTTLCIGRLLVELPANAEAKISTTYLWMESQNVARVNDFDDLERQLAQRADQYKATRMVRNADRDRGWRKAGSDPDKLFGATQLTGLDIDPMRQQVVLSYQPDPERVKLLTELHKVVGQRDYVFVTNDIGANNYPQTRQAMWSAGTAFQPLAPGVIPHAPGFCVEGGMFADTGRPPVRESFTLVVTLPDHPDVRFVIDASAIDQVDKDEPSLKHRVDSELGILRAGISGHVNVLQRGSYKAAGQDGYQIAVSAPYDRVPNTRIRKFFWSADGVPNDVTRPFMEIDMTIQPTNDGQSTINDDAQAKKLWEQLMQGLRIRPGAV